ncbi:ras association domain-containing protein 1 [Lampris incognitus]|uniref:ras association domain-containing protein 1 n=1 Tax=Lampris incognitus TaxID=2546036 RepID=UPI0024B4EA11|nr:ras association domain-containing protein 1 [Lampris incognitus]
MHQGGRKYSPTRFAAAADAPLTLQAVVNKSRISRGGVVAEQQQVDAASETSLEASPPPSADDKTRVYKPGRGAVVRAVRRHPSPQPSSLESLEAAWSRGGHVKTDAEAAPAEMALANGHGGAPRSRRRSFRPPDVRTIFSPRGREGTRGQGHAFGPGPAGTWCDACCGYIIHDCLACAGCKYTCHAACRDRVALDCHPAGPASVNSPLSPHSQDQLNNNTPLPDVEKERELRTQLSREEIRQKIEQYNILTKDHLKMTLNPSGVYTGFIKVQLELRRPVTVRGCRGGAGSMVGQEAFYLPRGATNTLHISSNNTVKQVIVALLNKFTVADNPAKYALYKRYHREEQVYVCKLADGEHPLFLRLVAGPDNDMLSFVLREQQTGEVMWDAFSIPELRNFLRILEKEEQEQVEVVTRRYDNYRQRLQEALRAARGPS